MEYKTLGSLVDRKIGYGIVQPGQNILDGVPVIKVNNLITGLHSKDELDVTTKENDEKYSRTRLEGGELIVSVVGTVGKTAIVPKSFRGCNLVRAVAMIDIKENWLSKWVKYYIDSPAGQAYIEQNLNTTVQATLNIKTLVDMPIPFPKEDEMRKIVTILDAIDRKIECDQQINDNLEQQAAALFSSLYNRSNTEVRYTDLIQILGGGTPKTGETAYWNGNIAFFTPKDVGTPYTFITEKTITEEGLSHCNSRLYPVNTVFVTARGTVGKVGLSGIPMAMNQSCYALVGKETHQLLVYFYTLKAVDRLKHKASGAVFDAITTRDFDSEQIMKLSDDDAKAFLCVAEPMFQEMLNNSIENLRLSTLRDFLLPKLMSGEIDVSSVQL